MTLAFLSFFAGILTVFAPCVLPLLPVILSGSLQEKNMLRPFVITLSLAVSILIFTILLKASTLLIHVPASFWQILSGIIIFSFGISLLFPETWEKFSFLLGLSRSQTLLTSSGQRKGIVGMMLLGASLGPVFATCSPTYTLILATVLPAHFLIGFFYLIIYCIGLSLPLFLIALFGQRIIQKTRWVANPHGTFKQILGAILVFVGLLITTGLDKDLEAWILDQGSFRTVTSIEQNLLRKHHSETEE